MNKDISITNETKIFGGWQKTAIHPSESCNCQMRFSIFLPPQAEKEKVPVLYWLSGLTCTDENFVTKAGAQRYAAEEGIAIVTPDTSPRGEDVPDDPEGAWDFGLGAGFYVNATESPWSTHYHMYDYVTKELPELVGKNFPVDTKRQSISGHSMGGHGAIVIALKNPGMYKSVSAFAPIVAPSQCPWGEKAFSHYLGNDRSTWLEYDSCALITTAEERLPILVDQGDADGFLKEQLMPEKLKEACHKFAHPLNLRYEKGYDHSYYFIASFIGDHIVYHAKALKG